MTEPDLPSAVIPLMKGVVYRDTHERAWKQLLQLQPHVRDYVEVLGLQVVIDEAEGYAFLRQRPADEGGGRPGAQADPAPCRCPSTSACCSRCCGRSSPSSTPRAVIPG